jgi:protein gp37
MALTPQHTYQVLTKRPERYVHVLDDPCRCGGGHRPGIDFRHLVAEHIRRLARNPRHQVDVFVRWPLENVWLGTSIESDDYVHRADTLRAASATTRFLSLEPLLGPLPSLDLTGIDWVIVGGESGPGHRPLELDWVRDVRDRCVALGIPLFFKQVGGYPSARCSCSARRSSHRRGKRARTASSSLRSTRSPAGSSCPRGSRLGGSCPVTS